MLRAGKAHRGGTGAALERTRVARVGSRASTGFECAGCSGDDCNEGSDGKKGREPDEHLFRGRVMGGLSARGDGMLFC